MIIQFFSKDIELSKYQEFKEFIQNKLIKLNNYGKNILSAHIEIKKEKSTNDKKAGIFKLEINLKIPKKLLRAEENGKTLNSAFNKAYKEIKRQLLDE